MYLLIFIFSSSTDLEPFKMYRLPGSVLPTCDGDVHQPAQADYRAATGFQFGNQSGSRATKETKR